MEKTELEFAELKFIPQEKDEAMSARTSVPNCVPDLVKFSRNNLKEDIAFLTAYTELIRMYMSVIEKNVMEFLDRDSTDEPIEITLAKTDRLGSKAGGLYLEYCELEMRFAELAVSAEEMIYDFSKDVDLDAVYELKDEINKKLKDEKKLIADRYSEFKRKTLIRSRNKTNKYVMLNSIELDRRKEAEMAGAENKAKAKEQKRKERQLAMQNPNALKKPNYLTKDDMQKWLSENPNATEYVVPEGVAVIGENAFGDLQNLTKVTLPQSLVVISMDAFFGCDNLKNITVPKNVQLICGGAFRWCRSLETVTFESTTPPEIRGWVFDCSEAMKKIIVPKESVNAYLEDLYWRQYASTDD